MKGKQTGAHVWVVEGLYPNGEWVGMKFFRRKSDAIACKRNWSVNDNAETRIRKYVRQYP